MNVADVIAPEYLNLARDDRAQSVAESLDGLRDRYHLETGTPHSTQVSTRLIFREGRPIGVQGIARDLTERKHSEEALRESQAFFNSFMDNSPAVAFMKDDEGRYVYVNKPFEKVFGQKLSFLKGRTSFDWLPPINAPTHSMTISRCWKAARRVCRESACRRRKTASLAGIQVSHDRLRRTTVHLGRRR